MDHRDSLGTYQRIEPGAINWMTAGAGIVHSERTPPELQRRGWRSHGLQLWVGLPLAHEELAPSFRHTPASAIPVWLAEGLKARVLIGALHNSVSPVATESTTLYLDVEAAPGSSFQLPARMGSIAIERACYSVDQPLEIDGVGLLALHPWRIEGRERRRDTRTTRCTLCRGRWRGTGRRTAPYVVELRVITS